MTSGGNSSPARIRQLRCGALLASAFGLVAAYVLFQLTRGEVSWAELAKVDPKMLALALSLVVFTWVVDGLRMKVLVQALGGRLSLGRAVRVAILGTFVSNVTPFDSGGEPFQAYLLSSPDFTPGQASAVVAVKTVLNVFARVSLGLTASVALLWQWPDGAWRLSPALAVACGAGILVSLGVFAFVLYFIIRPERIQQLAVAAVRNRFTLRLFRQETIDRAIERLNSELIEFRTALDRFVTSYRVELAKVLLLSFGWWLSTALVPALVLRGLGFPCSIIQVMAITVVFYLAAAYAPTPGSSGAAELGFAALFSSVAPRAVLGVFVMVWRAITYYLNLALGAVLMATGVLRSGPSVNPGRNQRGRSETA